MEEKRLTIGLFGLGSVGGGVYNLIQKYQKQIMQRYHCQLEIKKICVQDPLKNREDLPLNLPLVTDKNEILLDSSINCIIELIGGITDAKEIIFRAVQSGKHVITANKAFIATYMNELQEELLKYPHVRFAYEAAVCGSIPIIHSLQTDFVANKITRIMGIMNGTTNFILSKMEDEQLDYQIVLKEAQSLGFAEADPTADVEGYDVRAKIAILAKLSFGQTIPLESISMNGITKITSLDFLAAKFLNCSIKLIGLARIESLTNNLTIYVTPMVVPKENPLANVKSAGNMVLLNSDNMDCSTFSGPGAGRYPTANSVLNDAVRIAQQSSVPPFPFNETCYQINSEYTAAFYLRLTLNSSNFEESWMDALAKNLGIHLTTIKFVGSGSSRSMFFSTNPIHIKTLEAFLAEISLNAQFSHFYLPFLD